MGIPSIIPLIKRNPSLFKPHILRKCNLVIDGKCLENYLFNNLEIDKECGGDYDVYATKVEIFFKSLSKFEIDPIVVFDGGYEKDDRKLATLRTRAQNRINDPTKFAPILVHETFLSAIKKMDIKHVVCDFEADHEMVVLANEMRCPVLSFDSDFFIFELIGGYIPIAEMQIELLASGKDIAKIEVRMFRTSYLTTKFPSLNGKLPLLASALGNDYVTKESESMQMFYKQLQLPKPDRNIFEVDDGYFCAIIRKVLSWLENCRDIDTGKHQLMRNMRHAEKRAVEISLATYSPPYKYSTFNLGQFIRYPVPEETSEVFPSIPNWMVHSRRLGTLPNFIQNTILTRRNVLLCQVEDTHRDSSHECSKYIRQVLYGILLGKEGTVQELNRSGDQLRETTVHGDAVPLGRHGFIANLNNIHKMKTEQRLQVLKHAMTSPLPSENLAEFHNSAALFLMVLVFWLKSSREDVDSGLTNSLLFCFIILTTLKNETMDTEVVLQAKHIKDSLESTRSLPILTARHPLAQFQSCLKVGVFLNKVLDYPVRDINPATSFSGSMVHRIFETTQRYGNRDILTKLRKSRALLTFYENAMDFIKYNS